jgi:hypothetical protein
MGRDHLETPDRADAQAASAFVPDGTSDLSQGVSSRCRVATIFRLESLRMIPNFSAPSVVKNLRSLRKLLPSASLFAGCKTGKSEVADSQSRTLNYER